MHKLVSPSNQLEGLDEIDLTTFTELLGYLQIISKIKQARFAGVHRNIQEIREKQFNLQKS